MEAFSSFGGLHDLPIGGSIAWGLQVLLLLFGLFLLAKTKEAVKTFWILVVSLTIFWSVVISAAMLVAR